MRSAGFVERLGIIIFVIAAGAGCSGGGATPRACQADDGCGAAARCVAGACVGNAPPVAAIAPAGAPEAFALVELDGGGSADPDAPRDAIVSHAWTISAVDAPCAPPVVAGTGSLARVRFGCAGRYAVELVVRDQLGAESAPARLELDVAPYAGTPPVTAGPDVALGHLCQGEPLRCAPDGPVALTATLSAAAAQGPVRWRWTVEPPAGRALGADRRVTFSPGSDAAAAGAAIETDGGAISGDWVFRVEASDDAGVLGTAATRVSVGNRAPAIAATPPPEAPHTYEPAGPRLVAAGRIPISMTDPDGDPLEPRTVTWHHAGDGDAGAFEGDDLGDALTFRVAVPYASPADAAYLTGGAGLERTIVVTVADANGELARAELPVTVGNRPPAVTSAPSSGVGIDHAFDAVARRYRATQEVWRVVDPDGDPIWPTGGTGDAACDRLTLLSDGATIIECSGAYQDPYDLAAFIGTRTLSPSVADPWTPTALPPVQLSIGTRPPTATSSTVTQLVTCSRPPDDTFCCRWSGSICVQYPLVIPARTYTVTPQVSDADGDPVEVVFSAGVTPTHVVCEGGVCERATAIAPEVATCTGTQETVTQEFSVTDGAAWPTTPNATFTFVRSCQ
ncbi:conserved hypothetical protein [Anaeromyxobacter sp. K]|uniref:hypothetical protein n=1 Tax=Anaeromyxobacter sp. (strain K) TaxID=447217 RepID=UPI00015F943F|nr:hypothetical protein [Anaeromyxobacter sp. K]ACG75547.1 conserved hypothetical protein [Anaeromyxobacter sp. K]